MGTRACERAIVSCETQKDGGLRTIYNAGIVICLRGGWGGAAQKCMLREGEEICFCYQKGGAGMLTKKEPKLNLGWGILTLTYKFLIFSRQDI